MNIAIVPAEAKDVRGMQEVYYRTWLATYPNVEHGITIDDIEDHFKEDFTEETLAARAEHIRNPLPGRTLLFAKDGDKVVGICSLHVTEEINKLRTIYVLPEYQGKGVGTMLWNEIQKSRDPNKDTYVAVATYNAQAIGFYKKLGFVDTGKRFTDERFRFKSGSVIPEMELVMKTE